MKIDNLNWNMFHAFFNIFKICLFHRRWLRRKVVFKMHIILIVFLTYLLYSFVCGDQVRYSKQYEEKDRDPWNWHPVSGPFGDDSTPHTDFWAIFEDINRSYDHNWGPQYDNTSPYADNRISHKYSTSSNGNIWRLQEDAGSHAINPNEEKSEVYGEHGNRAKPLKVKGPKSEDDKLFYQSLFGGQAYVPPYMPAYGLQYYGDIPIFHPPFLYTSVYHDASNFIRKDKDKSYVPY